MEWLGNASSEPEKFAEEKIMRVALLTGGGDAPGLNGIIESCAKCLLAAGVEVIGIRDGFEGIFDRRTIEITPALLEGLHSNAGTCLGTSNKSNVAGREEEFVAKYKSLGVEGIIAAGGDGTFASLSRVGADVPILGVPKTIDNDLSGTEITFGYDTACSVVADAVDALRATASAHRRVMVVETMGRTAGWIALGGGLASYSDVILIPERPFDRGALLEHVKKRREKGFEHLMIAVSEGAHAAGEGSVVSFLSPNSPLPERLGGIGERIARWIEKEIGWESRHVVLGHLQRSAHPTTTDRFLTLAMGVEVAQMARSGAWGQAVVYRDGRVRRAPLSDLMQPARLVAPDHRWLLLAKALGIFI
jgi:6-phosphofructokinase 1